MDIWDLETTFSANQISALKSNSIRNITERLNFLVFFSFTCLTMTGEPMCTASKEDGTRQCVPQCVPW